MAANDIILVVNTNPNSVIHFLSFLYTNNRPDRI